MQLKSITLHSAEEAFEKLIENQKQVSVAGIKQLEAELNVHVSILNKERKVLYSSITTSDGFEYKKKAILLSPYLQLAPSDLSALASQNINPEGTALQPFYKCDESGENIDYLEHTWKLKNDYVLRIIIPTTNAGDSTLLIYFFILLIAVFSVLFGGIVVHFFSNSLTVPLREIKSLLTNIIQFDFSRSYTDERKDEIGELGRTINILSKTIHATMTSLEDANNKLKNDIKLELEAETSRKNFISSVSHELKTPLAIIQGYAEGLRKNIVSSKEKKDEYCSIIIDEVTKMDRLVKDLHDLLQFDSGHFTLQCQVVNIYHLIERIIDKFSPLFKRQSVKLKKEIGYSGKVYADPIRIEQVVVNYIKNALNHLDKERILKISIKSREKDQIRISVYNSGKPIPVYELDNIWTCFYRINEAGTSQYEGTGLGLSIVRSIMNLHQTAYGVTNKKHGVEFWFDLKKII